MPDQLLNVSTICSCDIKAGMVAATRMASSAYHLLVREKLFDVSVYPFLSGFYPSCEGFNQEYEDEWGEGVSLDRASQRLKEARPSVRGEKFCVCVEV